MARKFFRRYLPDSRVVRGHQRLRVFGRLLHDPNLWHLNRHSLAGGLGVGLFMAFMPMPFQMIPSAALAILFRVNMPIALAGVWVSNPLTMAPMLYFQYRIGLLVMGEGTRDGTFEPTLEWYWTELVNIWQPLLLGSVLCGLCASLAGYGLIHLLWRLNIRRHLRRRKEKRAARLAARESR
ncbi:DUF2062 domain-containing protein [Aquisalimonas sp.]|uniref:DUF2062 domain-containing protein n=1 Tax=unclassified Aquisalimonas TaxID=2644645 RepID=UPI0025BE5E64|nr:DUF2062 domain-containing protein [Aquisalimonas sp.]